MKRAARIPSQLSESMHKRLSAYTLAASAAGVGVLALAQPAEATIVYKHANIIIGGNSYYLFNPADQSAAPFIFWDSFVYQTYGVFGDRGFFRPYYASGAAVLLATNDLPAAVHAGSIIGSGANFGSGRSGGMLFSYGPFFGGTFKHHKGNFKFDKKEYLGFTFAVSGQPHFGWARLSVSIHPYFKKNKYTKIHLTGYAYETIPNKPILAGQEHGRDEATLGRLAQGATGVSREKK